MDWYVILVGTWRYVLSNGRIKGFDGIRGIAAFLVIVHHTLFQDTHLGDVSVHLFFALSGFLIFGILARGRNLIEDRLSGVGRELTEFWKRRALRIFPVYYMALLAGSFVGGFDDVRRNLSWYLSYTQNFIIAFAKHGDFSQTWSLAVEQQFYVLFALIFLLVPTRRYSIAFTILSFICASAIGAMEFFHLGYYAIYMLPFEGFLFILGGGVVALYRVRIARAVSIEQHGAERLSLVIIGLILFLSLMPRADNEGIWSHYFAVPISLCNAMLVGLMALLLWLQASFPNILIVRLLETRILVFFGSISYALYVFHLPVYRLVWAALNRCDCGKTLEIDFFATVFISIGLALLSHEFIEEPLLKLGRRAPDPGKVLPTEIVAID